MYYVKNMEYFLGQMFTLKIWSTFKRINVLCSKYGVLLRGQMKYVKNMEYIGL